MFLKRKDQFGAEPAQESSNTGKVIAAVGILGGLAAAIGFAASASGKKPQGMAGARTLKKRGCGCGR